MSATPPRPIGAVAALALLKLPLPASGEGSGSGSVKGNRAADLLSLNTPASAKALMQLATAGLEQIEALVPALQRALKDRPNNGALNAGHVARSLADAAHWIDAGLKRLIAEGVEPKDNPAMLEGWRQAARAALREASEQLTRAERQLENPPSPIPPSTVTNDMLWALTQVRGAQREIRAAYATVSRGARPRRVKAAPITEIPSAIALVGVVILLGLLLLAESVWAAAAILTTLGIAIVWVWRIAFTPTGIRLEIRR